MAEQNWWEERIELLQIDGEFHKISELKVAKQQRDKELQEQQEKHEKEIKELKFNRKGHNLLYDADIDPLRKDNEKLYESQENLMKAYSELKQDHDKVMKELNDGYSAAMTHNIELANHNIKLSKELQEAQEKINQLVDNCNTLEVNKDAYKQELQILKECQSVCATYKSENESIVKSECPLFDQIEELKIENTQLHASASYKLLKEKELEIEQLKDDLKRIKQMTPARSIELLEENSLLKREIARLKEIQEEIELLKEELQDLHKREEHFIKEGLRLNQELQDKTKELEEYKAKVRKIIDKMREEQRVDDLDDIFINSQRLLKQLNEQSNSLAVKGKNGCSSCVTKGEVIGHKRPVKQDMPPRKSQNQLLKLN